MPDTINFTVNETVDNVEITVVNEVVQVNVVRQNGDGGSVDSVNNKTGVVVLNAADVGAEPVKGVDDNYVTDAEKTKLSNLSGVNTGDQDLSGLQPKEIGKGLSQENYTTTEKNKVANIPSDTNAALSLKLDASAYNDRFKGKFTTLIALQTAFPTANIGDYAQVDAGSGSNVKNYNWDSEDGWILGGDGTGATNTDGLIEGSSNLYFTTARVLATILTGISFATGGAIVSTDTVLQAFGKIQKQINDVLTALSGKQDTLVSGTNIRPINGNSLLGSGNLVLASIDEFLGKEFQMTMATTSGFSQTGRGINLVTGVDAIISNASSSVKFLQTMRRRATSAATAGSSVLFGDETFKKAHMGRNYTSYFIFGNEDVSPVANARLFVGYHIGSSLGNVNPSTLTSIIGVAADTGDTNLQIIHNDASGLCTKIDLGSAFPANTSSLDFYLVKFEFLTSGNVTITVTNLETNTVSTNTISTNKDAIDTHYFAVAQRNNGNTALAVRLSLIHWSVIRNSY